MADEKIIRALKAEAALDSTYSRAMRLARGKSVLPMAKRAGTVGSTIGLAGRVKGSDGSYYSVTVDLDVSAGEVLDYSCTCPAAARYLGMCKHEIALALVSLGGVPAGEGPVAVPRFACDSGRSGGADRPQSHASGGAAVERPTSEGMSVLLGRSTRQRLDEAAAARPLGASRRELARLVPTLCLPGLGSGEKNFLLKLSVARGAASYVVKSIAAFAQACREGAEVAYGKRLSVIHVPSAFDEASWRLADLVTQIVESQVALDLRGTLNALRAQAPARALALSDADAIRVLDVLQGQGVEVELSDGFFNVCGDNLQVSVGTPRPACTVTADAAGGLDVRLSPEVRVLLSGDACYVVDAARAQRTDEEFARKAAPVVSVLATAGSSHVSSRDVGEFCRSVLPVLRAWCDLAAPASLDQMAPPAPFFRFRIGEKDGSFFCDAAVSYGDWSCAPGAPEAQGQPQRDLAAEYHVCDVLADYFPLGGAALGEPDYRFGEDDEELLFRLLTDGLSELDGLGEVLLSERLRGIRVRPAPSLSVRATVKSDLLNVELGASGLTKEELVEYLDGFSRQQRYVRLTSGDLVRIGDNLKVAQELADGLGVSVEELAAGRAGLASARSLLIDALLERADGVRLECDAGFHRIVRDFESYGDADIDVPAGLEATLRGYQEDGFRWLGTLERLGFGGILADDMGLGKTLQVIAHVLAQKETGRGGCTLVVCPASLVYNWMSEISRFAPGLAAVAVLGTKAARRVLIGGHEGADILVTSYDLLRRDVEEYAPLHLSRVVLDEAQYIKNPKAQVTRAVKCLDADVRLALTGTPIENRLAELWSIFDFLMPGYLGTRDQFAKRYEGPVEAGEHDGRRLLRCAIGPFVLRRLKSEVLADLPEKTESVVYSQMSPRQRKLYLATQDRLALQVQHMDKGGPRGPERLKVLAELTRLRQICCDPRLCLDGYEGGSAKLETCLELVSQARDAGHRVLVFSQFASMLDLIGQRLSAAHVTWFQLTGRTSKEARERLVRRFQAGEADVFLVSLKAGGVGLNLTAADVVIHYDPWWNVAAQDQATDRAYRIGQRRDVSVMRLVVEGTVEEKIVRMQEAKRDLAASVLDGEEVRSLLLTRDDLLALLGAGGDDGADGRREG